MFPVTGLRDSFVRAQPGRHETNSQFHLHRIIDERRTRHPIAVCLQNIFNQFLTYMHTHIRNEQWVLLWKQDGCFVWVLYVWNTFPEDFLAIPNISSQSDYPRLRKKVGISCFCPPFVSSIQEASICQSQIVAWSAVNKKLESLFWRDFGGNPELPQDSLCVSQLGYSLCVWGYSRGFSGGIRGYSGVVLGYSRPGAFKNHWFYHIAALDLFGPSDSYIILRMRI